MRRAKMGAFYKKMQYNKREGKIHAQKIKHAVCLFFGRYTK